MRDPINRYVSRLKSLPPNVQVRRIRRQLRGMDSGTSRRFMNHPAVARWLMAPKIRETLDKESTL